MPSLKVLYLKMFHMTAEQYCELFEVLPCCFEGLETVYIDVIEIERGCREEEGEGEEKNEDLVMDLTNVGLYGKMKKI